MSHHVVGDQRERHAAFVQFPRGKPRALQVGPRFRHEHAQFVALFDRHANHAQRRADSRGRESTGIALRHHLARRGHQLRAEAANRFVGGALFCMNRARFFHHGAPQRIERRVRRRELLEPARHAFDGPEQIHSRRPRLRDRLADARKFRAKFFERARAGTLDAERHAHRRRHADGRRAANHHVLDRRRDFAIVRVGVVNYFSRQAALVEHDHTLAGPFNGLCDVHGSCRVSL